METVDTVTNALAAVKRRIRFDVVRFLADEPVKRRAYLDRFSVDMSLYERAEASGLVKLSYKHVIERDMACVIHADCRADQEVGRLCFDEQMQTRRVGFTYLPRAYALQHQCLDHDECVADEVMGSLCYIDQCRRSWMDSWSEGKVL